MGIQGATLKWQNSFLQHIFMCNYIQHTNIQYNHLSSWVRYPKVPYQALFYLVMPPVGSLFRKYNVPCHWHARDMQLFPLKPSKARDLQSFPSCPDSCQPDCLAHFCGPLSINVFIYARNMGVVSDL